MQRTSRAATTTGEKGPAPVEKRKRRKRRGILGLPAGVPALILLVGAVALGRMAADDYAEGVLDLNAHLVREPTATFFVRARGDSMIGAGIHDGDLLVVDRSLEATNGKVVIVSINGELTVKRLCKSEGRSWLIPENPDYPPIDFQEQDDTHLWGVVTNVVHSL